MSTPTLDIEKPITMPEPAAPAPEPEGAPESTPGGDGGPGDIKDFEFDDFADPDAPEPAPEPAAEPVAEPAPEPVAEPAVEPVAEPVADAGDADDPDAPEPAASSGALRDQVVAANERARAAAARESELEAELKSLREERDTVSARLQKQTEAIVGVEAASHPDVLAIEEPYNQRFEDFLHTFSDTGGDARKLKDIGPELMNLRRRVGDSDSEGFEERLADYRARLEDEFPDQWREVATMVGEGMRVTDRVKKKIEEISKNAEHFRFDAARRQYTDTVKRYEQIEGTFGQVPPDLLEADPNHPKVVLNKLIESIPALKERQPALKQHLRRVNLPLAPLDPAQLAGMSHEDQNAHLKERLEQYEADRLANVASSWENYNWRLVGPVLHKLLQEAQGRSASLAKSTPAPRDSSADHGARLGEDDFKGPEDFEIDPEPYKD